MLVGKWSMFLQFSTISEKNMAITLYEHVRFICNLYDNTSVLTMEQ